MLKIWLLVFATLICMAIITKTISTSYHLHTQLQTRTEDYVRIIDHHITKPFAQAKSMYQNQTTEAYGLLEGALGAFDILDRTCKNSTPSLNDLMNGKSGQVYEQLMALRNIVLEKMNANQHLPPSPVLLRRE